MLYSDTNDQSDMIVDQLQKMKTYAAPNSSSSSLFLLSWTLTQGITPPIVPNGENANWALIPHLWPALSRKTYPNIISIDGYPKHRDFAALSMAINLNLARQC